MGDLMGNPNGAIQAISSAATTTLGLGIAFMGFWAYGAHSGKVAWSILHLWVIVPTLLGFLVLAVVPFVATRPSNEESALAVARYCYAFGASTLFVAICGSFVI
jgi:hypothetical protein